MRQLRLELTLEPGLDSGPVTGVTGLTAVPGLAPIADRVADPATSMDELAELLSQAAALVAVHPGPAALELDAEPAPDDLDAVARSAGFEPTRTLLQMRRSLPVSSSDRGRPPADAPPLRAFRPGIDDDAWLAVNNRAFAWHPEQSGWTRAHLAARMAEPWFRADGFLVHDAAPELVGDPATIDAFCWTKIHVEEDPPIGEIFVIGVDPDAHGKGLGRALTLAGLDWLAEQGLTVGMLYVEADNDAAVHLYRELGFTEHLVHRWWRTRP